MKQKLVELQKEMSTVIVDFNTLLSVIDRTTKQEISKDIKELKNTINPQAQIDTYRIVHNQQQNMHFSQGPIEHILR